MKYSLCILFILSIIPIFSQNDSIFSCSYSNHEFTTRKNNKIEENRINNELDSVFNLIKRERIHVNLEFNFLNYQTLQEVNSQTLQKFKEFPDTESNYVDIHPWHYLSVYKTPDRKIQSLTYDGISDTTVVFYDGTVKLVVDHEYFSRPLKLNDIDSITILFDENHSPTFISFVLINAYFNLPKVFISFNAFEECNFINALLSKLISSNKPEIALVKCQEKHYSLYTQEYWFDLVIKNNKLYELNKMHNWIDSGYGMWESGKVVIDSNSMILIADNPKDPTSTIKVHAILVEDQQNNEEFHFISKEDHQIWKILNIENEEFKRRILIKSTRK